MLLLIIRSIPSGNQAQGIMWASFKAGPPTSNNLIKIIRGRSPPNQTNLNNPEEVCLQASLQGGFQTSLVKLTVNSNRPVHKHLQQRRPAGSSVFQTSNHTSQQEAHRTAWLDTQGHIITEMRCPCSLGGIFSCFLLPLSCSAF